MSDITTTIRTGVALTARNSTETPALYGANRPGSKVFRRVEDAFWL